MSEFQQDSIVGTRATFDRMIFKVSRLRRNYDNLHCSHRRTKGKAVLALSINGREWLARQLGQRGVGYERYTNSLLRSLTCPPLKTCVTSSPIANGCVCWTLSPAATGVQNHRGARRGEFVYTARGHKLRFFGRAKMPVWAGFCGKFADLGRATKPQLVPVGSILKGATYDCVELPPASLANLRPFTAQPTSPGHGKIHAGLRWLFDMIETEPFPIDRYVQSARARSRARRQRLEARRERAWAVARRAAAVLRKEFGVSRVVLFGSLAGAARFHMNSDVDLAVWGLKEHDYYRALARLLSLEPTIEVDLVEVDHVRPSLRKAIQQSGILL